MKAVEHDAGCDAPGDTAVARRGPLRPIELATASVLGAMTVVLVIAGWFLPHASAVTALGAVPMGVVAYRHRPRAVVAAVVASVSVGFLVAGTGVISTIVVCGLIGGLAGHARQHRWGAARLVFASAVLGPVLAAAVVGLLTVFSTLRKLTLEQLRNTWRGLVGALGRLFEAIPGLHPTGVAMTRDLDHAVDWGIRNWWETVAVAVVISTVFATILAWRLLEVVFLRLDRVRATDRLEGTDHQGRPRPAADGTTVAPVPVELAGVRVRYPGAVSDALADVDLQVGAGEMVAVLGPNGSGKSTLSRLLAGCEPTAGDVRRGGPVGLGAPGGTAIVSQRPESQVLGVRVADDLVWGLPRSWEVDTAALLADVGLSGMEARETSSLSGGQLQRLAVAAALARRPRLLISDESTAMIDAGGRQRLVGLLHDLPHTHDMTVVHVTHRLAEAAGADRIIELVDGRVVAEQRRDADGHAEPDPLGGAAQPGESSRSNDRSSNDRSCNDRSGGARPPAGLTGPSPAGGHVVGAPRPATVDPVPVAPAVAPLLRLRGVGHVYADGTPWRQTALVDIDLDVRPGDGVLVVGGNGSGKSTLAWILAGLLRPTFGDCDLDERPTHAQVGSVAIAFQHARLQVQRSTVGRDVQAAGDVERDVAEAALRRVGLEPASLWERSVDELSGGQLRRVALAGLLTRTPRVLVLDEPLAGLDGASRRNLISVLAALRAEQGLTLIVISHDLEGAGDMCDRVLRLRSGRVTDDGPMVASTVGAR